MSKTAVDHNGKLPRLLVLAGGFGTRLRQVVFDRPKPLAPIGEQIFLKILLEHWILQGVREFTFLLHHEAEQLIDFLEQNQRTLLKDCTWEPVIESQPLGTGGAVANAVRQLKIDGAMLIANADTWVGSGIGMLASATPPALVGIQVQDISRYGGLELEKDGVIKAFIEKGRHGSPGWINAGIYHLNSSEFSGWDGNPFSMEQDLFPRLVEEKRLRAVPLVTDFIDIGIPSDYYRFVQWIESDRQKPL